MARRWGLLTLVPLLALLLAVAGVAPARADEPDQARQWGLRKINAPAAWATATGAGVPIAVIDTGVDRSHPDLAPNIAATTTCVGTGGDPAACAGDGHDVEGHGTHVSGIAAAARNGAGIAGVAPDARLYVAGVFVKNAQPGPDGGAQYSASSDDVAAGIRWAVATAKRPGVINLSLGDSQTFLVQNVAGSGFENAVEEAWRAGWVTVAAIGNDATSTGLGVGAQNYSGVDILAVGATGPDDEPAWYTTSLANTKWGVVAPGGDAPNGCDQQAVACVVSDWPGGTLAALQGTSMATPHVAGAAALLLGLGLTNANAVQRLLDTANRAVPCGSGCSGRIDAGAAVAGLSAQGTAGGATAGSPTTAPAGAAPAGTGGSATATVGSARPANRVEGATAPTGAEPPAGTAPTADGAADATATSPSPAAVAPDPPAQPTPLSLAAPARRPAGHDDLPPPVPTGVAAAAVLAAAGLAARRVRAGASP